MNGPSLVCPCQITVFSLTVIVSRPRTKAYNDAAFSLYASKQPFLGSAMSMFQIIINILTITSSGSGYSRSSGPLGSPLFGHSLNFQYYDRIILKYEHGNRVTAESLRGPQANMLKNSMPWKCFPHQMSVIIAVILCCFKEHFNKCHPKSCTYLRPNVYTVHYST